MGARGGAGGGRKAAGGGGDEGGGERSHLSIPIRAPGLHIPPGMGNLGLVLVGL
jgi:hypothetical protein